MRGVFYRETLEEIPFGFLSKYPSPNGNIGNWKKYMKCDRCGKEIIENFFELDGDSWEKFAQSDLEMILCEICYKKKNYRKGALRSYMKSSGTLQRHGTARNR